jgi:uncharacterized protein YabE (DUF348 family)
MKIVEDPTLPEGTQIIEKKAIPGYVVKSYRVVLENGKEILVEPLFTDRYNVLNGIKRVGTMKIDPPPANTDALDIPIN